MRLFKKFSIISPCNNEEENIEKFISEIDTVKKIHDFNLTLLLIDDGSNDIPWNKIKESKKKFNFLKAVKLSRNFGKESALDAGLNVVGEDYDFHIIIDADLQHPINQIPNLIKNYQSKLKMLNF